MAYMKTILNEQKEVSRLIDVVEMNESEKLLGRMIMMVSMQVNDVAAELSRLKLITPTQLTRDNT